MRKVILTLGFSYYCHLLKRSQCLKKPKMLWAFLLKTTY